jgi:hypothetical protein
MVGRAIDDAGAALRLARGAPGQIERLLHIGDQIVAIGRDLVALGERVDRRGAELIALGGELDQRANALIALGDQLDARAEEMARLGMLLDRRAEELLASGAEINALGDRIHDRGGEIVDRADNVVHTGDRVIEALPTLERALQLATPLEGAIDRVGRFVDRLPGGATRAPRRRQPGPEGGELPPGRPSSNDRGDGAP